LPADDVASFWPALLTATLHSANGPPPTGEDSDANPVASLQRSANTPRVAMSAQVSGPDLTITSVSVTPDTVVAGQYFTVSWTLKIWVTRKWIMPGMACISPRTTRWTRLKTPFKIPLINRQALWLQGPPWRSKPAFGFEGCPRVRVMLCGCRPFQQVAETDETNNTARVRVPFTLSQR